jgi:sulfur-oxidizing protein SoxB
LPWGRAEGFAAGANPQRLLDYYAVEPDGLAAHALTHLDYLRGAQEFGRVGGFAHLATLIDTLRATAGEDKTLLLDGGDSWQGSATALWTEGRDMVGAANLLGIDAMTGHWEFTYPAGAIQRNVDAFSGAFLAQNITRATGDAGGETGSRVFPPYLIKEVGERRLAVIGQAYPHTHAFNPPRFTSTWKFGFDLEALQQLTSELRERQAVDCILLLSHNGLHLDVIAAQQVQGIDVILGGHSHRALPQPLVVKNSGGKTLVAAGGSHGKFIGVLDLEIGDGRLKDFRYRLLPVFSDYIAPEKKMAAYIADVRRPFAERLAEPLAQTATLLYSSGALSTPWAEVIGEAQRRASDADMGLTPGFRWGTTVLPGETITMEDIMAQLALTYPETYVSDLPGAFVKLMLEDQLDKAISVHAQRNQDSDPLRLSGMLYDCSVGAEFPERISNLRFADGKAIDQDRQYRVAGWATTRSISPGPPIWDVVADYLRDIKTVELDGWRAPTLLG